ncbi:LPS-assembly protein LptD [Mangrovibrevibacter kandeliae]|uniref:LPS-assembly protein LptD n=1 Tax=Mangrovibrevibacter kandeliae TaxID=2968473 RepID=UPI0021193A44|nr:LPS-assembly protein LptD [Aurantimonas sp. CSK15Z-1]MCQ8781382.1 LPS-assembly protein LptD [Aurantimonas sp. CSK15Z-1]
MRARGTSRRGTRSPARSAAHLAGTLAVVLVTLALPAHAQPSVTNFGSNVDVPKDAQMFLEADTVTYDSDTGIVTASGGVQIDYGGYKLVSREVTYNQKTKRLFARGDVQMQQPDGNKVYADVADISDDFADGFVKALRIETPENTRFAAATGVRQSGSVTSFEQGVYTACESCREHPERAPLWQVKARRIVWNQQEKVVRYYGARFEFFGAPIAYLPYFQSPDPTVKRKSGFLAPTYRQSKKLGFGVKVPYFWALSDSLDATITPTYFTRQGLLGEVEVRQAFENGYYTLKLAGIDQREPDAFLSDGGTVDTPSSTSDSRGMIGTTGRFEINPNWTFGWNILAQTDENFSQVYAIEGFDQTYHTSEIYLTGLGDRSFFDLRGQKFEIQSKSGTEENYQPIVTPTLDYEYIDQNPVFGGEAGLVANAVHLSRGDAALSAVCSSPEFYVNAQCSVPTDIYRYTGLEGDYTRASARAYWQRAFTTDAGLVITPGASLRGDVYSSSMDFDDLPKDPTRDLDPDGSGGRVMPTGSLLVRYPWLLQSPHSSQVIEPIAQLLVRPNEMQVGQLPNEDAQSLVFNTSNLFSEDKFSGFDRVEGGTRLNVGLKYVGTLDTGYTLDAMFGQSYHLFGENSFAQTDDFALVGYDSGLETDVSDYVGSLALTLPIGLTLGTQGRFDEESFENRRTDVSATYGSSRFSAGLTYSFIGAQPIYGVPVDRRQINVSGNLKLTDNWSAFGGLGYDLENDAIINRSFGVGYADECFTLTATYQETNDRYQQTEAETTLLFTIGLRTIADTKYSYDLNKKENGS